MSRPNGRCSICGHGERGPMELLLAGGASARAVASKFDVSNHALWRHWAGGHVSEERKLHLRLGPVERAAWAARINEVSASVLDHLKNAQAAIYQMLDAALAAGDRVGVAMLVGRLHENLRELGRLTGELADSPLIGQQINIFMSPQFAQLQAMLIKVLAPHPAARADVISALRELEATGTQPVPSNIKQIGHSRVDA
jgi:hypothetical protein